MAKIKIEDIRDELVANGWQLITSTYKSLDTELEYQCPEGHHVFAPWKKMRGRYECPQCEKNQYKTSSQTVAIPPKPKGALRTLALDQSSHINGWAIFDNDQLTIFGKFNVSDDDEVARMSKVRGWLMSMLANHSVDQVALEGIQYQDQNTSGQKMGVTVFQTLARLQGVLAVTCFESGVSYLVCPTNTWRHHCGVKGRTRADRKRSMQLLVKQWYDVSVSDDEADAIGIGRYAATRANSFLKVENWEI